MTDFDLATLTAKGLATMTAIGNGELSYFDDGIVANSGIWGECLTGELGHKSSGVIVQLVKQGMFTTSESSEDNDGTWYSLTELGAEVANSLVRPAAPTGVTFKTGAKWTYMYAPDGTLIAELRNDSLAQIARYFPGS